MPFRPGPDRPGVAVIPLFQDQHEFVRLERWAPDAQVELAAPGGIELLVLAGSFTEGGDTCAPQSWARLPRGSRLKARAAANGCELWVKTGHLMGDQTAPTTTGT